MKSFFRSFGIDELEAEVDWLNQRGAEGHALSFPPHLGALYWFSTSADRHYEYAIDLKPRRYYQDPERRAFLKDTGWEVLGRSFTGRTYLRRDAGQAGASTLYTDPESLEALLVELRRKGLVSLLTALAIIVWNVFALITVPERTALHWSVALLSSGVMASLALGVLRRRAELARRIDRLTT